MFFIEFNLFFAAAFGFVDGGFHGIGDFVGVQDGDAVHVAGGAAYGLNQAAVGAQEAFFVSVEDGDEGDFGDVEAFAQEVDADEYVKQSEPQISNDFNALYGVNVAMQVAHFDAEFAVIVGELLRHAFGEGGNEYAFAFLDAVVDFAH
ncbi:Uncharacterised protein [Mycobacteroides abscessus subsp. massiliense]|nr:Uncharacterised protein [Mycobacteroides abscessus subsp. massiliense]